MTLWIGAPQGKLQTYHRYCGSGDIMVLVCHMILQDHVIKGSRHFMGRSPPRIAKFGNHRRSDSGDIAFLVCHLILKDHTIKGSFDYMGGGRSW